MGPLGFNGAFHSTLTAEELRGYARRLPGAPGAGKENNRVLNN